MGRNFLNRFIQITDRRFAALESRIGIYPASILIAALLLLIAILYCTPAVELINHGGDYSLLSENPFDLSANNRFQYRILSPLIAHFIFLRGKLFIFFPLLACLLFIAGVILYFRKTGSGFSESIAIASLLVFSTPALYTLHFAGYVDTTSYLLLFLCFVFRSRLYFSACFFALALLNHEANLFALPWLIILSGLRKKESYTAYLKSGFAYFLALLPLILFRQYLSGVASTHLTAGFYLSKENIAGSVWLQYDSFWFGIFEGFKLFWFLPLGVVIIAIRKNDFKTILLISTIILSTMSQLFFACDTSRLMGLAFPAIIIAAVEIRDYWGRTLFLRRIWILILLNLLVPQYFVGAGVQIPFLPLPLSLFLKYYMDIDVWELNWV